MALSCLIPQGSCLQQALWELPGLWVIITRHARQWDWDWEKAGKRFCPGVTTSRAMEGETTAGAVETFKRDPRLRHWFGADQESGIHLHPAGPLQDVADG